MQAKTGDISLRARSSKEGTVLGRLDLWDEPGVGQPWFFAAQRQGGLIWADPEGQRALGLC